MDFFPSTNILMTSVVLERCCTEHTEHSESNTVDCKTLHITVCVSVSSISDIILPYAGGRRSVSSPFPLSHTGVRPSAGGRRSLSGPFREDLKEGDQCGMWSANCGNNAKPRYNSLTCCSATCSKNTYPQYVRANTKSPPYTFSSWCVATTSNRRCIDWVREKIICQDTGRFSASLDHKKHT